MEVLIIIFCLIAYYVIGAFCVAKFSEDFMNIKIDPKEDKVMLGGLTQIWPMFMLLYLCSKVVILIRSGKNGR